MLHHRFRTVACAALLLAAPLVLGAQAPAASNSPDEEVRAWRTEREARLRSETGWLTLAGLFWLQPGQNAFGSGKHNPILLPASAPPSAGVIEFGEGQARYRLAPGVAATLDGQPAPHEGALRSDADGEANVLGFGAVTFYVIRRGDRYGVRVKDRDSAARRDFKGLEWYPLDESYRVTARFVAYASARELAVPNILGQVERLPSPGYAEFTLRGREFRLEAVLEEPDAEELFFIFRDRTAGHGSYAAGRFLYSALPKDGSVVLDFNKAYNPPCALTRYATCPLPPEHNHLPVAIPAGERFSGQHPR